MTCLFIFRRDLRNVDNNGLRRAYKDFENVIPCFIYDKRQIGNGNKYKSNRSIEFMKNCVLDLKKNIPNFKIYKGSSAEIVISDILKKNKNIVAIYVNRDYTQFSLKRDKAIAEICKKANVIFKSFDDQLLIGNIQRVMSGNGTAYKVFTPFYNKARKKSIDHPVGGKIVGKELTGPRSVALKKMRNFDYKYYAEDKDYPWISDGTSKLSKYLKFGVISIREAYKASKKSNTFRRQLFWKDFWTYINFWYGDYQGNNNRPARWTTGNLKKKWFKAWKEGKTGFPIIDAGMRQLKETGWMHNRVRMLVASFLSKDLLIDWRDGEKWFSNMLVDIDMAVNRGNWMSVVGVGHSDLPYFRVFNPWTNTEKYDDECVYIKKWIPELRNVPVHDILDWDITWKDYKGVYFKPIVDHEERKKIYLDNIKK